MRRTTEQLHRAQHQRDRRDAQKRGTQPLLPARARPFRAEERLHAAAQRALGAGHARRAGPFAPAFGSEARHGVGIGAALLRRAAKVGFSVAGVFLTRAHLAPQQPHQRVEPVSRANHDQKGARTGDCPAVDVYKLVAEDGVERLIVVILAVEQQLLRADDHAHRPRQAGQHAHFPRWEGVGGIAVQHAAVHGAADARQRLLDRLARRTALTPHAPMHAHDGGDLPEKAEDEARQPHPRHDLQRPGPPRRRQFPQAAGAARAPGRRG